METGAGRAKLGALPLLAAALALAGPPGSGLSAQPAAAACRAADAQPGELTRGQARDAVLCLINSRRATRGKGRLDEKPRLRSAAAHHTRLMRHRGCFAHECPGEKDLVGRIQEAGYLPCNCSWGVGENLAWGEHEGSTPRAMVKAWMRSRGHRRNILDGAYEHIGVGVEWGAPSRSGARAATYTTDFGYKRG
jgi:uncharacterized protein YkwD